MKTTLRIVQLANEMYAVQKRVWFTWKFFGINDNYIWEIPLHIEKYCLMKTLEEAEMSLEIIIKIIQNSRADELKIVKKVRV